MAPAAMSETTWDATSTLGAWERLARRAWRPPTTRTVVVVPHPDDEVLACGGLIATQRAAGVPVVIVAVTDGEASHDGVDREHMRRQRQSEQQDALGILGVSVDDAQRLGLPDGEVPANEHRLMELLLGIVKPQDLLVAPWVHDHHSDHEACGRAAQRVARLHRCSTVGSLVWGPVRTDPLESPPGPLLELALSPALHQLRLEAMESHRSQTAPINGQTVLIDELLNRLRAPVEWYVSGPS